MGVVRTGGGRKLCAAASLGTRISSSRKKRFSERKTLDQKKHDTRVQKHIQKNNEYVDYRLDYFWRINRQKKTNNGGGKKWNEPVQEGVFAADTVATAPIDIPQDWSDRAQESSEKNRVHLLFSHFCFSL
jgi:hypothetical protein